MTFIQHAAWGLCAAMVACATTGCEVHVVSPDAIGTTMPVDGETTLADSGAEQPTLVGYDATVGVFEDASPWVGSIGGDASVDDANGDVPEPTAAVARLVFPLSDHRVTTHRPDLRWVLARGDGASVEICRDRACTLMVTTFDAVGTHSRPPDALTPGVYFWRIFERTGGARSSTPTATWHFRVDARDTPVDTAWSSGFDINNDGYQDIFTPDGDVTSDIRFLLFLGGPAGPGPTPNGHFSDWIGVAGDINGDGFGDVTIGEDLYFGSPAGISTSPAAAMPTPYWFPVGDNNNDGYGDIMIYPPRPYRNSRLVSLVPGGPRGLLGDLGVPVTGIGDHKRYQTWGATAGDLNGDRREDAIVRVGTPGKTGDEPGIEIVRSRGTSWETARRLVCGGWPTQSTVAVGDVNGDGYADLWAKCYGARPYFAAGGPSGSPTIRTPSSPALYVYPIGDVNGDGCSDLIMSDDSTSTIHYGVAGANVATTAGRSVGRQDLRPVYDANGDGYDDLLEYSGSQARIYLGSPAGPEATPSVTLFR